MFLSVWFFLKSNILFCFILCFHNHFEDLSHLLVLWGLFVCFLWIICHVVPDYRHNHSEFSILSPPSRKGQQPVLTDESQLIVKFPRILWTGFQLWVAQNQLCADIYGATASKSCKSGLPLLESWVLNLPWQSTASTHSHLDRAWSKTASGWSWHMDAGEAAPGLTRTGKSLGALCVLRSALAGRQRQCAEEGT